MGRVVILGSGYLGLRLAEGIPNSTVDSTDIRDVGALAACLERHEATAVINAAAKTGRPNVDWCESHKQETYEANVVGALNVARACAAHGAWLLHIGSGCVFSGRCPYREEGWTEEDPANPLSFYARSKYAADLILSRLEWVAIARIRMPIDGRPHPRNLLTKLAGYPFVLDAENSVTIVDDLVLAARGLLEQRASGIYHVTNPGILRHRELLTLYRLHVDPHHRATLVDEDYLLRHGHMLAPRSSTILASPRLRDAGIELRPIDTALEGLLRDYARQGATP